MPNRYVREAAIKSKAVNSLSWQGEVFWRRMLNLVDDFGRYSADPEELRADVFPRQLEKVREADISRLLAECEQAGLLFRFEANAKWYLVINQWEQGRAKKSKYPSPPDNICKHLLTHTYDGLQMSPTPTPTQTPIPSPSPNSDANNVDVLNGKGGCKGGGEPPRAIKPAAGQIEPPRANSMTLRVQDIHGVVKGIVDDTGSAGGWWYDNHKVDRSKLVLGSLKSALVPFVERLTIAQVEAAWKTAASEAHQGITDSMNTQGSPEAYAVGIWQLKLKQSVGVKG